LITVRGLQLIRAADALVYDRLVALALLEEARPQAERHNVGKVPGHHSPAQQAEINQLLIRLAGEGKQVVRLKGGDAFVFGRGGEEACALVQAGVAWEVVPGVTSAVAAPAYAGIPVTHRGVAASFAVATGHPGIEPPGIAHADTLVVLMAVGQLDKVVTTILDQGRAPETPAAVVQAASTPRQRTIVATLGTILDAARQAQVEPPATLVVGPTVRLSQQLGWYTP
jgi:uroporphyrin-III C-methyltransferase